MDEKTHVLELLQDGNSIRQAAQLSGVSKSTVGRWAQEQQDAATDELLADIVAQDAKNMAPIAEHLRAESEQVNELVQDITARDRAALALATARDGVNGLRSQLAEAEAEQAERAARLDELRAEWAALCLAQDVDGADNTDAIAANEREQGTLDRAAARAMLAIGELQRRLEAAQGATERLQYDADMVELNELRNETETLRAAFLEKLRTVQPDILRYFELVNAQHEKQHALRERAQEKQYPRPTPHNETIPPVVAGSRHWWQYLDQGN